MGKEKISRGITSQFFVAGELCRRGYSASLTLGNTPNTDILCSNLKATKFVHIQVKTYRPGDNSCMVGKNAEKNYGRNFFWVLAGIPKIKESNSLAFEYYIIPSSVMSRNVGPEHERWGRSHCIRGKKKGQLHDKGTGMRCVFFPRDKPSNRRHGWIVNKRYKNRWRLIENKLK